MRNTLLVSCNSRLMLNRQCTHRPLRYYRYANYEDSHGYDVGRKILHPDRLVGSLFCMQGETAERILKVAEALMIERGYSAFSYADISEAVEIKKPSIHHHFPTKAGLAAAVLKSHREKTIEGT